MTKSSISVWHKNTKFGTFKCHEKNRVAVGKIFLNKVYFHSKIFIINGPNKQKIAVRKMFTPYYKKID